MDYNFFDERLEGGKKHATLLLFFSFEEHTTLTKLQIEIGPERNTSDFLAKTIDISAQSNQYSLVDKLLCEASTEIWMTCYMKFKDNSISQKSYIKIQ